MHRGYVKLWRKSKDNGLMTNPEAWLVWCRILLSVTHKSYQQVVGKKVVELEPGQMITGRKALSTATGLSEKIVRNCLELLEKMGNITKKRANKYSIITICNWETYQMAVYGEGPTEGPTEGQQGASKGPQTRTIEQIEQEEKGSSSFFSIFEKLRKEGYGE